MQNPAQAVCQRMLWMINRLGVGALRARVHGRNHRLRSARLRMYRARWSEVRSRSTESAQLLVESVSVSIAYAYVIGIGR
jgi:hypothetical protein